MNLIFYTLVLSAVVLAGCNKPEQGYPSGKKMKYKPRQTFFAVGDTDPDGYVYEEKPSGSGFFTVEKPEYDRDGNVQPHGFFSFGPRERMLPPPRKGRIGIDLEYLEFKAIQDGIKYGQYNPQAPSLTPISHPLDQHFEYFAGSRVTARYALPSTDRQELRLNWMYYHSHPEALTRDTTDHSVLAVLSLPTYGITQNQLANSVKGHWMLNMNAFEFDVKIPLRLAKRFCLSPSGGIKLGFVDQHISAHYKDILDESQFLEQAPNTPLTIRGKSKFWGLGPLIGLEGKIYLPQNFGIFFTGGVAALAGRFSLRTVYSNMLNVTPEAKITVKDHLWRVSVVEQIKAGLDKRWSFRTCCNTLINIDFAVGWEVQVWTRQWRLNMFDSFVEPSDGSDLTLYGPFVKLGVTF